MVSRDSSTALPVSGIDALAKPNGVAARKRPVGQVIRELGSARRWRAIDPITEPRMSGMGVARVFVVTFIWFAQLRPSP